MKSSIIHTIKGAPSYYGRVFRMESQAHETTGNFNGGVRFFLFNIPSVKIPGTKRRLVGTPVFMFILPKSDLG